MAKPKGERSAVVASVATKPLEKVKHENIYAALAAFQGENPAIKRTKEFGKEGEKMHWWYAPLDEILQTVRPLTAKHGLAFTWEQGKSAGEMVCAVYHETYKRGTRVSKETVRPNNGDETLPAEQTYTVKDRTHEETEENVIRSMPVKVRREGDKKEVGSDSTYARRYTLAEVLAIAPDEDNDIAETAERAQKLEGFAYTKALEGVKRAKTVKEVDGQIAFFTKELKALEEGKVPSLALKAEQYTELTMLSEERKAEIGGAAVGHGKPGENKDGGGDATLPLGETGAKKGEVPPIGDE